VRVVVVADGPGGSGLADGLGQPLLQPGIDLPDKVVPIDKSKPATTHTYIAPMITVATTATRAAWPHTVAPLRKSLHAGTNR
jgi:hypothetical protein